MIIPQSFRAAVWKTYTGEFDLDDLIKNQEQYLRRLARYALRFKTEWYVSDEDDMFQEACVWLVRLIWEWEEDRGTDLSEFIAYNIGARLSMQIKSERAKCRHPDANTARKVEIWSSSSDAHTSTFESLLCGYGNSSNPEVVIAIRKALEIADQNLTKLANELLVALANNDGCLAQATRELLEKEHIRKRFGVSESHLRYVLDRKVMPEIFDFLAPKHVIPVETV